MFRAEDTSLALNIFMLLKKKAAANSKAVVMFLVDNVPMYEGRATLCVMAVHSLDPGKLRAYF